MSLLKLLPTSVLGYGGGNPPKYTGKSVILPNVFQVSTLDLDGKTPPKYLDNPPG